MKPLLVILMLFLGAPVSAIALATAEASGDVVVLDVPASTWYRGCAPTSGGMVIAYWDAHGYGNLLNGSVYATIASAGHDRDYWVTPDRVPTAPDPLHADDSIADFMHTSRGYLPAGWTDGGYVKSGMDAYANWRGYPYASASDVWSSPWAVFVSEIDAGRPVLIGWPGHLVVGFGYDSARGYYAEHDTYSLATNWKLWGGIVYLGFFDPGPLPGDANNDGKIDGADLALWQQHYDPLGLNDGNCWAWGDWNGDRKIDGADLALWQENYSPTGYIVGEPIPELATLALVGTGGLFGVALRLRFKMDLSAEALAKVDRSAGETVV